METEIPVITSTKLSTVSRKKVGVAACGTITNSATMATNSMSDST